MSYPETQHTLLARLGNPSDAAAWSEFCEIYEPTTYRLARRYGLQDADAREVTQEVLLTVSRKIHDFDLQRNGRFRGWLNTIARNTTIDAIRKRRIDGQGGTDFLMKLQGIPGVTPNEDYQFDFEARREQFRWAANQIRKTVSPNQWESFWLTAVEGRSGAQVAERLNLTVGAVYVARCRVLAKIKQVLAPYREEA